MSSELLYLFSHEPQTHMVEPVAMVMKARLLLARNIHAVLQARGENQSALATWCRKKPSWINKILAGKRPMHIDDLDRVADFLGLSVYQLFQPGISALTERRKHAERRLHPERRIGHAVRFIAARDVPAIEERHAAEATGGTPTAIPDSIRALLEHTTEGIDRILRATDTGGQTPPPSQPRPATRPRRRKPRRSDAGESDDHP